MQGNPTLQPGGLTLFFPFSRVLQMDLSTLDTSCRGLREPTNRDDSDSGQGFVQVPECQCMSLWVGQRVSHMAYAYGDKVHACL